MLWVIAARSIRSNWKELNVKWVWWFINLLQTHTHRHTHCISPPRTHSMPSLRCRDRTEGEERSEAVLSADHRQQVPLGGADHPDGGLLGRGPHREAWLRPHQDLRGQTQQVRLTLWSPSLTVLNLKSQFTQITKTASEISQNLHRMDTTTAKWDNIFYLIWLNKELETLWLNEHCRNFYSHFQSCDNLIYWNQHGRYF